MNGTLSKDTEIQTWENAPNGKFFYCFNQEEVQNEVDGETITSFTAEYIEMSEKDERKAKKILRAKEVSEIIVEVDGMQFNGDETSQTRMTRAYTGMEVGEKQIWTLIDNTPVEVEAIILKRASRLAGIAQTALWKKYA